MKYDYEDGTTVETNIDDEGTRMGISPDSIAHIVSVLTDGLYQDPAEAAARETLTNAADAHVAAGNTAPIRVFLPTEFSSVFEVIDHGTGMTEHTLRHEFGQYGFSSKRDSDDFNGMLGLGCKAPLAYTPEFTVVSVKDGLKNTALVGRDSNGVGRVKIPAEVRNVPTDEPNGTTVQIPVIDVDSFNAKVRNILRFWDPGSVIVNGEPVETIWESNDVVKLDDDVLLVTRDSLGHTDRVHVVMAGVTYPLDYEYSNEVTRALAYGTTVVARIPTGSVNIPATRDSLTYSAKTQSVITTLAQYVAEATERRFTEKIAAATTASEAMGAAKEARSVLRNFNATWQGNAIPAGLRASAYTYRQTGNVRADYGMKWGGSENLWNVTANSMEATSHNIPEDKKTLVVSGYSNSSVSAINKAKVQRYVEKVGLPKADIGLVLFRSEESKRVSIWLDDTDSVIYAPWEDVKDVDLPESVRKAAGYTPPSRSSHSSTAAPSDDLSEVRRVIGTGGYRVIDRETVLGYDRVLLLAPSDANKGDRETLYRRLDPLGIKIIVVNKHRHDDAHDLFGSRLFTMDTMEDVAEAILRERYEALPISDAAYTLEFAWSGYYHSPKRTAETLIRQATNAGGFFNDDHRINSLEAILRRIDSATAAKDEVVGLVRTARAFYGWVDANLPVYLKALGQWIDSESSRNRTPLDALIESKMKAFHTTYPLFQHIHSDESALAEYARLLDAAS